MIEPNTSEQQRHANIAHVRAAMDDALCALMLKHSLTLPNAGRNWRATASSHGVISGMEHMGELTILCTDGVVAWFEGEGNMPLFYGHVQHFSGEVKPLFSLPSSASAKREDGREQGEAKSAKTPHKREPKPSLAMELLSKLTHGPKP